MAVKGRADITLGTVVDVASVQRYYLLQASTLTPPAKPTVNPPSGWATAEPTYTDGSTNSLYTCDMTTFCDSTFSYSDVSLSSSYEAAKAAYNKAAAAQETANQKTATYRQATAPTGRTYAVNDTWYDTANGNKMYSWNGTEWIPQLFQAKAIDVNSLFADVISTQSFNMEVIKNDAGFIGIQANYEDPDDPESSSKNTIDLSATTYASGTEDVKYSEITLDQNGNLTLHCTGNMQIISENNEIIVPGNGQKTYTTFDGSILSGGSIVVVKKIGWCQVFGYLKPSAPVTNFTQVLDAVKVPAPEHGANITPTVPSWYSASDLPARVRVQATGGLAIQGGTANREYNFSITYPIA